MTDATIDGTLPVLGLQWIGGQLAAHVDPSIGDGCHYYRFQTGDEVTVETGEKNISGVIESVQIEHGVTLWIRPDGDGMKCHDCEREHSDWEYGAKKPAGPDRRGWVQPVTCQRCGAVTEVTGL